MDQVIEVLVRVHCRGFAPQDISINAQQIEIVQARKANGAGGALTGSAAIFGAAAGGGFSNLEA